jgi:polysaccharide export outer membrane protein
MRRILLIFGFCFAALPAVFAQAPTTQSSKNGSTSALVPEHYTLVTGDVIEIKVFQEDELNTKARVEANGTINMALLGTLKVGGKSVEETQEMVLKALQKDFIYNPQVTISVIDFAKRRFAILGQVMKPGFLEMPPNQKVTLLQAIAMAGGYTQIANPSKVAVKRIVDGKEKVINLNAKEMAQNPELKNFDLEPDDTVTVYESKF